MSATSWRFWRRGSRRFPGIWPISVVPESLRPRRDGKWMHYRIVMPPNIGAAQVLRQTLAWLKEERACRRTGRVSPRLAAVRRSSPLFKAHPYPFQSIAQSLLRPNSHVQHTVYPGPNLRAVAAEEALVPRSLSHALDLPRNGDWSGGRPLHPGLCRLSQSLSERNDEYPDCHRADHHDVPAAGEGTIRKAGRSLP